MVARSGPRDGHDVRTEWRNCDTLPLAREPAACCFVAPRLRTVSDPVPRWIWIGLALLVVATLLLLGWSLTAGPEPVALPAETIAETPVTPTPAKITPTSTVVAEKVEPALPRVAATGTLRGMVHDASGQGVQAAVQVKSESGQLVTRGATDDKGAFSFQIPAGIAYRVEVQAGAFPLWFQDRVRVVANQATQLDVALLSQVPMRGRVVDSAGNAVAHAFVVRMGPAEQVVSVSDGDGQFIVAPEIGEIEVVAVHNEFAPSAPVRMSPTSSAVVRLQLPAGGAISGTVVDGSGQAIANATVTIERATHDGPMVATPQRTTATTQGGGSFSLTPLRTGEYTLRADAAGKAPGFAKDIRVSTGATVTGVILVLGSGATIKGRVTQKANGQPVAGARVALLEGRPGQDLASATTDNDGRYVLGGVGAGLHTIRVDHAEFRPELASGVSTGESGEVTRDIAVVTKQAGEHFAFQGIGAGLSREGNSILIRNVMPGTPAQQAGLQAGDRIVSVDRQVTSGMSLPHVIERIRGEEGTSVLLEVERAGQGKFTVQVGRAAVVVKDPP